MIKYIKGNLLESNAEALVNTVNTMGIMGYSAKDKKPFEMLGLIPDGEMEVNTFLDKQENDSYKAIVERTKNFLKGFYSPFGLELLSTIDFIRNERNTRSREEITRELESWSDRKKTLFTNPGFIDIAIHNLEHHL